MKLTDKEKKTIKGLVNKALDYDQDSLSVAEVKELESLLKKAGESEKEDKETPLFNETVELAVYKAVLEQAKEDMKHSERAEEKEAFKSLPLEKKEKYLSEKLNELENSQLTKHYERKDKEAIEQDFEKFYAEYAKKHGTL